ncbi:MAG: hypothetical protein ACYSWQ_00030 [Planctomycetota bacterium]
MSTRLKATESGRVLLAVNRSTAAVGINLHLPGQKDGSAPLQFEDRILRIQDGRLSDRFAPLAVHIYTFVE